MTSADPTQTCELCGRQTVVVPQNRGFPPDIAKRKLKKLCNDSGCPSEPRYLAGIGDGLLQMPALLEASHDTSDEEN